MPKKEYTYDAMLVFWNKYAESLLKRGNLSLHSAMVSEKPKLENNTIICEIPNQALVAQFDTEKIKLIQYIRENLNNYSIQVSTPVATIENIKMIFTDREKYSHMLEKNPLLENFVKTLNLDLQ